MNSLALHEPAAVPDSLGVSNPTASAFPGIMEWKPQIRVRKPDHLLTPG